jgi:hypothetical protein
MTSNNARNNKPAAAPEPDDSGLLISLDAMIAALRHAHTETIAKAARVSQPVVWTPATVTAAAALPVPVELPTRYPVKGPSAQLQGQRAFIAAPKDLAALDAPACPDRRNDPLLAAIRAALLNDWPAIGALHNGPSAAEGGILPLPVLLTVLAAQPNQQKARKWAQILTGSGQTNILAQVANVAGRFAILRPEGITLIRDFYAAD